jgi:arginine decarboxylase
MWTIEDSQDLYGIERWSNGYFSINEKGNLAISPNKNKHESVDVMDLIRKLDFEGTLFPVLFRFPQIFQSRMEEIHRSFLDSMEELEYSGEYQLVFPIKVNQRKDMVDYLARYGKKFNVGLEVGTKTELLAALSINSSSDAMLVCNGYKDKDYLELALSASILNKNIIIVIDLFDEIFDILRYSRDMGVKPRLGLRVKLFSKGSGRWAESGGESSKFGLSTNEILEVINILSENEMLDQLDMLHFHIGSQITDIRKIKDAMNEAARIYCKIRKITDLAYFNVGGGLSVDYDGSMTDSQASANYSLREYSNDVVYTLQRICEDEDIPIPTIISESGRAISAYHSFLVFKIIGLKNSKDGFSVTVGEEEAIQIQDLNFALQNINLDNYSECYHDALHYRDELFDAFNLGNIDLNERAKGEMIFWMVCQKASKFALQEENDSEEFENLKKLLSKKYIGNFSLFQSVPDMWGVEQIFPIMPLHRHKEFPSENATIVDITCDSDGEIKKFAGDKDYLELHKLIENEDYYLGIFLLGAYQDTLGDFHNLLGCANEVHVMVNENGWSYDKIDGYTCERLLDFFEYDPQNDIRDIQDKYVGEQDIDQAVGAMQRSLKGYTYFRDRYRQ